MGKPQSRVQACQRSCETPTAIKYRKSLWNRFDATTFTTVLLPILLHKTPNLSINTAVEWCQDEDFSTHLVGVRALLCHHYTERKTWETLISLFNERSADDLSYLVPSAFSKLLGNWDLSYTFTTSQPEADVKTLALTSIKSLETQGIAKLLDFLDCDEGFDFSRGTLGRAFTLIFEFQEDMLGSFRTIESDPRYRESIREMARELHLAYSKDPRWYWD